MANFVIYLFISRVLAHSSRNKKNVGQEGMEQKTTKPRANPGFGAKRTGFGGKKPRVD